MSRRFVVAAVLACLVALPPAIVCAQPKEKPKKKTGKFSEMQYGPHQMMTFQGSFPKGNLAYKGAVIRIGEGEGAAYVCFDTELLRYAAAWKGDFVDFKGVSFDGSHGGNPAPFGTQLWGTSPKPGVADAAGKFDDTRANKPFGPLPREHAKYRGLYHHDGKVILNYTVGETNVLELPGFADHDGVGVFTRHMKMSAGKAITFVLFEVEGGTAKVDNNVATIEKGEQVTAAGVFFGGADIALKADGNRVLMEVPARQSDRQLIVNIASFAKTDMPKFAASLAGAERVRLASLDAFTKGGQRTYTEVVKNKGTLGDAVDPKKKPDANAKPAAKQPYVVDTITMPYDNPYKSWMRTGGFDFFSDGTSAAVCTWSGDVWIVRGIDDKLENVEWSRFASGIHDGLGLKIVDDTIYVHGRDGITRLHDLNKDGQADHYECFNNDILTTFGFHEFAYELHTDKEGNFYFVKGGAVRGGGSGWEVVTPHHGCAFKLSKDGTKLEVIATGLRAPNGMGLGPNGELTTGDNEGTWVPKCRINYWSAAELAKRKGFGGVVDLAHSTPKPTNYDPPICFMPKNICNSGGGQTWVTSDKWGPFKGELLYASYGTCTLYKVLKEHVPDSEAPDGTIVQGGVVKFPLKFDSGTCRLRFNERDGQLYVVGIKGWQSSAAKDGSFQRVRYTGAPVNMPTGLKATKSGLHLTFTGKLDKESVDAGAFSVEQWNYKWTSGYGSKDYSVADPKQGTHDKVNVKSAKLSSDGRTVFIELENVQPVMQMLVKFDVEAESGEAVKGEIHSTINKVGPDAALAGK